MTNSRAEGLRALLEARSIAVVGASDKVGSTGARVLEYLDRYGYDGDIIPVNKNRKVLAGRTSFASISECDYATVDHALLLVPSALVEATLEECAANGVKSVSVMAGGYAEGGEEGRLAQERLRSLARDSGMRVLGPNCLGSINRHSGLIASASSALMTAHMSVGPVSIVTQSGAVGAYILSMLGDRGLGLRYFVSTGNEIDIQAGEVLSFCADDSETDVVVMYLEGLRDPEAFVAACMQAREAGKKVVVVKSGRTAAGAMAVQSHTAVLAGDDAVYDAIFERAGVIRARSLFGVMDAVESAVRVGRRSALHRKAVVVTTSGGLGVLASESLDDEGIAVPVISPAAQQKIHELLPLSSTQNPVDLSGIGLGNIELLESVLHIVTDEDGVDVLVMVMSNTARSPHLEPHFTEILLRVAEEFKGIVMAIGHLPDESKQRLETAGVSVLEDPADVGQRITLLNQLSIRSTGTIDLIPRTVNDTVATTLVSQEEATKLLAAAGMRFPTSRTVASVDEATSSDVVLPVVVKLLEPEVVHKSELGYVRLGIRNITDLSTAVAELLAMKSERGHIVIEEMIEDPLYELLIGAHVDPAFGLVFTVGLGGYLAEMHRDVAVIVPPLTEATVRDAFEGLSSWKSYLSGFRGKAAVDPGEVHKVLLTLLNAANEHPEFVEVEINPLIVSASGLFAVDVAMWTKEHIGATINTLNATALRTKEEL